MYEDSVADVLVQLFMASRRFPHDIGGRKCDFARPVRAWLQ